MFKNLGAVYNIQKFFVRIYRFSSIQNSFNDIQDLEQKAVLSSAIIHQIIRDPTIDDIRKRTLADRIKDTISKTTDIKMENKSFMLRYFTTGISVNTNLFSQIRQQKYVKQSEKRSKNNLFIFNPTSLITGQIFRQIIQGAQYEQILMGHSGISKTISFQLYWHLANIICKYKIKIKQNPEWTKNQNKNILNVPKLIYWNILKEEVQREKNQCEELGVYIKDQRILNPPSKIITLKQIYQKFGIELVLGIDQIHQYTSIKRALQTEKSIIKQNFNRLKQLQQKEDKTQTENFQQKQLQQLIRNYLLKLEAQKKYSNVIQMLVRQYHRLICLSSQNLKLKEGNLAKISKSNNTYTPMKLKRLQFPQLLPLDQTIYELVDYFIFEFKYQFPQTEINKKQQQSYRLRQILFNNLKQKANSYILTPLTIYEHLNTHYTTIKKQLQNKNQNINKYLQSKLQQLIQAKIQTLNTNFKTFFQRLTIANQQALIQKVYFSEWTQKDSYILQENYKIIFHPQSQQIISLAHEIDKHIFYEDSKGNLYAFYPKDIMLKIIEPHQTEAFLKIMQYQGQQVKRLISKNRSKQGRWFEYFFIQTICTGKFQLQFKSQPFVFNNIVSKKVGYMPIPILEKQIESFDLLKSFWSHFENINKNNKSKTIVCVPLLTKNYLKQKQLKRIHIDQYARCFDCVLISYTVDFEIPIKLYAFDLTIQKTKIQNIQNKIKKFLQIFSKLDKTEQRSIQGNLFSRQIHLYYNVISHWDPLSVISKQRIKQQVSHLYQFNDSQKNNYIGIDSLKKGHQIQKTYLKRVGNLCLRKNDMNLTYTQKPDSSSIQFYDYVCSYVQNMRNPEEKTTGQQIE